MRKDFGAKPWLYPLPVLIVGSYDAQGRPDAMNAAWGGIYESDQVILCLSEGHKTTKNIKARGAFTVSIADRAHLVQADYVGMVSANAAPDKMERSGLHSEKSAHVDAPLFDEFPMALECRLVKVGEDGHIIGEIVNVSADERILGEDGQIDADKLEPISFDAVHRTYRVLGETVGNAFSDGAALGKNG
ncbi:MAG: flavin reductase family protein [Clostridia bacterium]|nr:flavin reductase family protein [Clostridia bacterium]